MLTPRERHALNLLYGTVDNAVGVALGRSAELRELWGNGPHDVFRWPNPREFWELFWEIALPVLGIERDPRAEAVSLNAPPAQDDDDVEPDPRSQPDPIARTSLWKVVALLAKGDGPRKIEKGAGTGLSYRQVMKIRDWHTHPGKLGPGGGPGYRLDPGPTSGTVVLRKLRKRRSR